MPEEDLRVRVRLVDAAKAQQDARKTGAAVRNIGSSAKVAGAESEVASKKLGLMSRATGAFKSALVFSGVAGLAFGIKDAVHAGIEWQEQQAQLRVALGKTAGGMEKLKEINEAVDRSATRGGFAPADQIQAIQKFTNLTGDATTALHLNDAATDLARGAHISYAQAQKALASATVGQVRGLQKIVGVITPVTTNLDRLKATTKNATPAMIAHAKALDKQATAASAVNKVTQKFGGATTAYSKTAAGAASNAANAFDLMKERLGAALLPVLTIVFQKIAQLAPKIGSAFATAIRWIKEARDWFQKHKTVTELLITLTATLLTGYLAFRTVIGVIRAVAAAQAALNIVMDANPIGIVIVAIAALVAGFITLYRRNERFRHGVQATVKWIANAFRNVTAFVKNHWRAMLVALTGPLGLAVVLITHNWDRIKNAAGDVAKWIADKFTWLADKVTWPFRMLIREGKKAVRWGQGAINDITHPFGLHFAGGGLVPGAAAAGAGDTRVAAVSPGEYVLRRQVVSAVGAQNLQRLNQGGDLPGGQTSSEWVPGVTKVYIGARQVAEATTQYSLRKQARRT